MKVYIQQLKVPGFSCADFSLNDYLLNKDLGSCCNAKRVAERIDRINGHYHAEALGFCLDTGYAVYICENKGK